MSGTGAHRRQETIGEDGAARDDATTPREYFAAPLDGVEKVAVLGPGAIGDFVFALPALHVLKHTYPHAELVYLGKPWHERFLRNRPGPVDRVLALPPVPGVGVAADAEVDEHAVDCAVECIRRERFSIALQMFGGGRYSNPFMMRFGARLSVGARSADAMAPDRWIAHAVPGNRRLALLEVAALAGASGPLPVRELALTDEDRHEADCVLTRLATPLRLLFRSTDAAPLVILQPGSTDARRCWGAERFAAVGDVLAAIGARIAINGTAREAERVGRVRAAMRHPSLDLSGALTLGGLCGLIERAALVVSNDTGPLHLALALGTPCVGIFWHTNLADGMPLRPSLLRAAVSSRQNCPVCQADNRLRRCTHEDSFVDDVAVDEVAMMALSMLHQVG
jgi:ADP-heptose:LPS heptosyltransferase